MGARERKALSRVLGRILSDHAAPVLAVGAEPFAQALSGHEVLAVEEPTEAQGVQPALLPPLAAPAAGAVIFAARDPAALARRIGEAIAVGGSLAFVLPVARPGLSGAASRTLGLLFGRRPRPLEVLCGALLAAGAGSIRVEPLPGLRGLAVVHGRILPRLE